MTPEAILLSIRDRAGEGCYRFSCPGCMLMIEKPADRKIVALLLSAGVELEERAAANHPSALEAPEPVAESHQGGPPLTVDDLITFHFLLEDDARLYQALPRA